MSNQVSREVEADQQTRDELIHQSYGALVFAAAGSGKTTTVVNRIVNRLTHAEDAIEPAQVVAITFTRAAAAELHHRISRKLIDIAQGDDDETARRAQHAIEHLHEALIGTIDSFAADIARNASVFLDIPAAYEVLEDIATLRHTRAVWERIQSLLLNAPEYAPLLEFAFASGLHLTNLTRVALELGRVTGLEALTVENAKTINEIPGHFAPRVSTAFQTICAELRSLCAEFDRELGPQTDDITFVNRVRKVRSEVAAISPGDHLGFLRFATEWNPAKRQLNFTATERKTKWRGCAEADRRRLELAFRQVYETTSECLQSIRAEVIGTLGELIRAELVKEAAQRRRAGQYTYSEITQLALQVVRDDRAPCRADVREIIVDEIQDTDPVQIEFLRAFIERVRVVNEHRYATHVVLIGDPRQSIYSFRGADPSAALQLGETAGPIRSLDRNFRSRPEILDWIARYFERVAPDADPPFGRMLPTRSSSQATAPVSVFGGTRPNQEAADHAQFADVVTLIRSMVGHEQIEGDDGTPRDINFGDIAILLRTRTGLSDLMRTCSDSGIPLRLENSQLRYDLEVVDDFIALLEAIGNPGDYARVVAALRATPFSCSDGAIARSKETLLAARSVDTVMTSNGCQTTDVGSIPLLPSPLGECDVRVRASLEILRDLASVTQHLTLPDALQTITHRLGLRDRQFTHPDSESRLSGLDYARDALLQASRSDGPMTVADAAEWLRDRRLAGDRGGDNTTPSGGNAVRVMTIHGSKGLEFPVAIVCGLAKPLSPIRDCVFADEGTVSLKVGDKETRFMTEGCEQRLEDRKMQAQEEAARLAYVATTRARDALRISLWRKATSGSKSESASDNTRSRTLHERIVLAAHDLGTTQLYFSDSLSTSIEGQGSAVTARAPEASESVDDLASIARPFLPSWPPKAPEGSSRISPSRLVVHPTSPERSRSGFQSDLVFGSVAHRCMELGLRSDDLDAINAVIDEVTSRSDFEADQDSEIDHMRRAARRHEICRSLAAAEQSAAFRSLLESGIVHRELPVLASLNGKRLRGIIDLLIESPSELAVFDYKTDPYDPERSEALVERYTPQIGAYLLAVQAADARPVTRCGLVFLNPDCCEVVDIDPGIAMERATASIESPAPYSAPSDEEAK